LLESQVASFIRYAEALSLDIGRHWFCTVDGRIRSACTSIESPGRTAVLLLPDSRVISAGPDALTTLIARVVEHESRRDLQILQCLLAPDDHETADALKRVGFSELATLIYMEWDVSRWNAPEESHAHPRIAENALSWLTYDETNHDLFARVIADSYEDSLDCVGLAGLRDIEDIIEGHKAAGLFDPNRWLLLRCDANAAGCILLAQNPTRSALELVYMGVHPNFRRKHIGTALLQRGLNMARTDGFASVTVAVDAQNVPALRLYEKHGFRRTTARLALILALHSSAANP
jgi:ribosomal protein S18 acetylase RimI-like enzyme